MSEALRKMDEMEIINLERLAHLLKGLSSTELETLELLLDGEACQIINRSLQELAKDEGIPIDKW